MKSRLRPQPWTPDVFNETLGPGDGVSEVARGGVVVHLLLEVELSRYEYTVLYRVPVSCLFKEAVGQAVECPGDHDMMITGSEINQTAGEHLFYIMNGRVNNSGTRHLPGSQCDFQYRARGKNGWGPAQEESLTVRVIVREAIHIGRLF